MLESGADVNARHGRFRETICVAALRGHPKVVEVLLQHKASVRENRVTIGTALHCAYFSGSVLTVEAMFRFNGSSSLDKVWSLVDPVCMRAIARANNSSVAG